MLQGAVVRVYKQAQRRDDDIAIVNACISAQLNVSGADVHVETIRLAFGGMAPTTVRAVRTEAALSGR